jgi:hypothetical protein
MAETISLQDAATALKDHFGEQLQAGRADGLEMMVDVLRDRFGISEHDGMKIVEALEAARTIRWVQGRTNIISQEHTGSVDVEPTFVQQGGVWQL